MARATTTLDTRRHRFWQAARIAEWRRLGAWAALAIVICGHLTLFLAVFINTREDVVLRGFLHLSYLDSGRAAGGAVPYRDFLLEYPPGTLLFMLAPRLLGVGYLRYRTLFFIETALLDAALVATLYTIARRVRLPAWRVLGLYTLFIIALGPLTAYRLDLAPTLLTALAVLAWLHNRPSLAAAALAAGAAVKIYPILLLPPLVLDQWVQGRARRAPVALLAFAATLAIFLSPVLVAGSEGIMHALHFQIDRHLQVESIWATAPLLLHIAVGFPLQIAGRGRALVVLGPGDTWGGAGTPGLIVVTLLSYWLYWRVRQAPDLRDRALLLGSALLIVGAAILSKVLSPQYLIWIMPALALLPLRSRTAIVAVIAFGAALPLTQWIYPMHYGELVILATPLTIITLATRNGLLLLSLGALIVAFWRLTSEAHRSPRPES